MARNPEQHMALTKRLAKRLPKKQVYEWLVTNGYFPESYVLPPCFAVSVFPEYGKKFFPWTKKAFKPKLAEISKVHFSSTPIRRLANLFLHRCDS